LGIGSSSVTEPLAGGSLRWRVLASWLALVIAVTFVLRMLYDPLDKAHIALAFLLVVLVASARAGRVVGLVVAVASFLAFNFFLIPPFHTLLVADPLDWGVLGAFLVTGAIAAQLLHREQDATRAAERRAREIDRLAALGAESLSVARADEAVAAIVRVIGAELPVDRADILLAAALETVETTSLGLGEAGGAAPIDLVHRVLHDQQIIGLRANGATYTAPTGSTLTTVLPHAGDLVQLIIPLRVRDRALGVLWLSNRQGLRFQEPRASFADALAYYAALAAERVRLAGEAAQVEALREADRLKDAVLASLSHDLRTPLTSIRATAAELRVEGEERGAIIEEESERLNRLVTDLLDLSRLRSGSVHPQLDVNAAEDLVGAALHQVAAIPGASAVQVRLPAGEIPLGRFDFVHSLRSLTNLVENALRYSPGAVEIEVAQDGRELRIGVLDRGPGVPVADRERVFEPFFRSASASDPHGTGLGLAIADSLARSQGGSVNYRDRPGGGSIFELILQAVAPESLA
jgi:two-component system, OmpR family, sensor histidine kinase KdpD